MSSAATSHDAGLAGAGRAGDHFDGADRGEHMPGGDLIQPWSLLHGRCRLPEKSNG